MDFEYGTELKWFGCTVLSPQICICGGADKVHCHADFTKTALYNGHRVTVVSKKCPVLVLI